MRLLRLLLGLSFLLFLYLLLLLSLLFILCLLIGSRLHLRLLLLLNWFLWFGSGREGLEFFEGTVEQLLRQLFQLLLLNSWFKRWRNINWLLQLLYQLLRMLKVYIIPLMLLNLLGIEGLWRHKGLMIVYVLLLVVVILILLLEMILVRLIEKNIFRYCNDLWLSVLFLSIIIIIQVGGFFFDRIYDYFFDVFKFIKILVNSLIVIIMEIVDLISSLKRLDQIIIVLIMVLFLSLSVGGRFAASFAV